MSSQTKPRGNYGAARPLNNMKRPKPPDAKPKVGATKNRVLPEIQSENGYFSGDFTNIPPITKSEVRIFLSSTFTDYQIERNALVKYAYPQLKTYAAGLGVDLQVVDMRWGVTDDAANEHIAKKLCLIEIANCQRLSFGPNFVCLLGDRYGYMPFPNEIEVTEFQRLQQIAADNRLDDCDLLEEWYRKDNNAVPAAFILQPVTTKFPHFGDRTPGREDERNQAMKDWMSVENKLRTLLFKAAMLAYDRGLVTCERLGHYTSSVTEAEVHAGILSALFPRNSALCYSRTFAEFSDPRTLDLTSDKAYRRYLDILYDCGSPRLHDDAGHRLRALKTHKIPQKLPDTNIASYNLQWHTGGVDTEQEDHKKYVQDFCQQFVCDVKKLIDSYRAHQIEDQKSQGKLYTSLREEVFHHLRFGNAKSEVFCGRETEVECVRNYLSKGQCRQPFVIHASSGSGKTALSAILSKKCKETLGKNSVLIVRFLGTSADSANLFKLLRSICQQICLVYGLNFQPKNCNNYAKAAKNLHNLLSFVSQRFAKERPLAIVLDSLDQLDMGDTKTPSMTWLPRQCPTGVHFILSTLPDDKNNWLNSLKAHLSNSAGFMLLNPIDSQTSQLIIESYLSHKSRTVNKKQFHLILEAMENYPRPLFLKLLLDQACEWKSYQGMAEEKFPKDVREAIMNLFNKLECRYGQKLIRYSLGYMTAGVNGLSQVELEDVLSCNDQVLNEVYQYHNPPSDDLVRIPPLIWSRIQNDIQDYLVERRTDGKTTLFWYHRQFIEAAYEYFVKPMEEELNSDLAGLYSAKNGLRRTVRLHHRNLELKDCNRGVTQQPMMSRNKRMLNSLPHHLLKAGNVDKLLHATYCNFDLAAYYEAFAIPDLIQSLNQTYDATKDDILETMRDFLRFSEASITNRVQLAVQIVGQLGSRKETAIVDLCEQCIATIARNEGPILMPLGGCLPSSQSELKAYVGSILSVICISKDSSLIACRTQDRASKLQASKIINTEFLSVVSTCPQLMKDFGQINRGQFTEDKKWLVILAMKQMLIYAVETGEKLFQSGININNAGFLNNATAVSANKIYLVIASKERLCIGQDVSKVPGIPDYNLCDHKTFKLNDSSTAAVAIEFVMDTQIAVSLHNALVDEKEVSFVYVWDCESKSQSWCQYLPSRCKKAGFAVLNEMVFFGCDDGIIRYIKPLMKKDIRIEIFHVANLDPSPILCLTANYDLRRLSALRQDNSVIVFSPSTVLNCVQLDTGTKLVHLTESNECLAASNTGLMQIWHYGENRKSYERQVHQSKVDFLQSLGDGFVLTHSSKEEALNLWNFSTSMAKVDFASESRAANVETGPELTQYNVLSLCLSDDGKWLIVCPDNGPPSIWTLSFDPMAYVFVGHCESDLVCDSICLGYMDRVILARVKETKYMTSFLLENGKYGRLNKEFENYTACSVIAASSSSIGFGACFVTGSDTSRKTGSTRLRKNAVNIFTLNRGRLLYSINLLSLGAKTIDILTFTKCGRYLTVYYDGSTSYKIEAYYLKSEKDDFALTRVINEYTSPEELEKCFIMIRKQLLIKDPKMIKDTKCYAATEYRGELLLACHGICLVWNMKSDEQVFLEKIANSRQWMKHSTAWYFHQRSGEVSTSNVDASMGQTAVTAVCASESGDVIVTGAEDGSVIAWFRKVALESTAPTTIKARTRCYMEGHSGAVTSILLRYTMKTVVTASRDRTIRLWDIGTDEYQISALYVFNVHAVPERLWFTGARAHALIKGNVDAVSSSNRESYVLAFCSDIVKNYVVALRICHLKNESKTDDDCDGFPPRSPMMLNGSSPKLPRNPRNSPLNL